MSLQEYLDASHPMPRVRRAAVITDLHLPFQQHVATLNAFMDYIEDTQPDTVVWGGDFLDMESMSSHGGNASPPKLLEEVVPARRVLWQAKRVCPDAQQFLLEGNHEDRLDRKVDNDMPAAHGALTVPQLLGLDEIGVQWVPENRLLWLGKLAVLHGKWCNDHHAKKHLLAYGHSVLYGHTHKHQVYTSGQMSGDVHGAFGMPSACKPDPSYTHGAPLGWTAGFGTVFVRPDGCFNVYTSITARGQLVGPDGLVYPRSERV